MRPLFLTVCVIIGLLAGLWWNGLPLRPDQQARPPAAASTVISETVQLTSSNTANAVPAATPLLDRITPDQEASPRQAASDLSFNEGIKRVAPAVVSVYASEPSSRNTTSQRSQGSGVIVDADGIVLTNLHLVDNFDAIRVELSDGRSYMASLIGSDAQTDLAVVRIDADMLPFIRLDEAEPLKVGDIVLAIGNPFGVGQTVTQGIVSATRRRIANGTVWQNFIQIDAAINPGNSGGALINPLGQLVGVNTAVFRGDSNAIGIGYSIPAELLTQVVPQIIAEGSVSRGWLGLGVEDMNMFPALNALSAYGAVITAVHDDGPAALSGVRPMDVVVQLGEQPITNATQLLLAVSALPPGATVKLALLRSPDPQTLNKTGNSEPLETLVYKVRLGTRPNVAQAAPSTDGG